MIHNRHFSPARWNCAGGIYFELVYQLFQMFLCTWFSLRASGASFIPSQNVYWHVQYLLIRFSRNALSLSNNNDLCQSMFVVQRDFADVNFREIDIGKINWYQRQFLPFRYSYPQGSSKRRPMFVFLFQKNARFFKKKKKMYLIYK